jgi:predicted outer membrane repeat protein
MDLDSLYLKYMFIKDEGSPVEKTPAGGVFILEPGVYTLEVRVFANSDYTGLAAWGETDTTFTISAGVAAGPVNITLRPEASEGTGSLEFSLTYPVGATVETLTLTRIAGEEAPLDLTTAGTASGTDPLTLSGTKSAIPSGYYLLRAVIKNSAGSAAGRSEVVHIYQNLTAEAAYVFTAGDFRVYRVTSAADSGPGTLRAALTAAQTEPQTIQVVLGPGAVITLETPLPQITKSISIEGNGVTLTPSTSWSTSFTSQLLYIADSNAIVTIRRVHFKDGLVEYYGGAIRTEGTLTLESCIFSGNRGTAYWANGGAVSSTNTLTLRGCTFYRNTANRGGAVYFHTSGKTLTLTGNLFYWNTATSNPVVHADGETVSTSYNVVDVAFGTGTGQAGWNGGTGDTSIGTSFANLPVSGKSFKLYGNGAANKLPGTLPEDYPATDFYGDPISGGGAAGAVQASTANQSGYYLEYSQNNAPAGTVTVNPPLDADGLYQGGSLTFTANPGSTSTLRHWLVDGVETASTGPNELTITPSGHSRVQAVFSRAVTVNTTGDAGTGSLRAALTSAQDGDVITFDGVTVITLESPLPSITKSITIEGNGVTLTQLLYIPAVAAEVSIRGIHFKDGSAANSGMAIWTEGTLTLESCIFSGNHATSSGGAVYSRNTLTIRGCTFYGNTADSRGGAVYFLGASARTLTLTGNLFYGNTAGSGEYPVVYNSGSGTVDVSYNVVDVALGTGTGQAGWATGTGDTTFSTLSIGDDPPFDETTFVPVSGLENVLPSTAPAGFPLTDFYGTARSFPGAPPGAVTGTP